ncbi:hypothetical protein QAD02_003585 [Eretmocerus hayati]|uniref:Uncharacterized protein n=1 Tax=Eretmocerus hayati TaxID=131215 RepID=A0ACC2NNY3_9HYME|nr:hypothetical protein QAD02_003585 [Eretmocerus hayati]
MTNARPCPWGAGWPEGFVSDYGDDDDERASVRPCSLTKAMKTYCDALETSCNAAVAAVVSARPCPLVDGRPAGPVNGCEDGDDVRASAKLCSRSDAMKTWCYALETCCNAAAAMVSARPYPLGYGRPEAPVNGCEDDDDARASTRLCSRSDALETCCKAAAAAMASARLSSLDVQASRSGAADVLVSA